MFDTVTLDEPMRQIKSGIEDLAREDRAGWLGTTLSDRLSEATALGNRLDAEILRLTAEWDRTRAWEADGALSAASWMTHRLSVSRRRAHEEVRTARFVDQYDRVAKAVAAGDITVEHTRALARVVADRRKELFLDHEDALVDAAETLSIDDFSKVARRWGQLADDQLASDNFMEQYTNRRLDTASTFGGALHVDGFLDGDGGAIFAAAIDKLSPPDPKDMRGGPRTATQRRADALVQMSRMVLEGGEGTGVSPTNLNLIVDFDTMASHKAPRRFNGIADLERLASHTTSSSLADARCDLDWTGPIGRETLLRMSCDCSVSRIVMKGRSEVLDMGRKTRLVTAVQRRALSIRDGGCVFPGCDRPDLWCDAHHLIHWVLGGNTDLCDLCLLCRRHHVLVHEGGWILEKLPGGGFRARAPDR